MSNTFIPQDPTVNPIVINDDTDNNEGEDEDDFFGANDDSEDDTPDGSINQGVQRVERAGQDTTSKYKYNLKCLWTWGGMHVEFQDGQ